MCAAIRTRFHPQILLKTLFKYLRNETKKNPNQTLRFDHTAKGVDRLMAIRSGREAERQRADVERRMLILEQRDKKRLKEVIWDLILERVIVPGADDPGSSDGWPCFTVTEHGKEVIAATGPVPYDPDGYLNQLRTDSPNLHPTVLRYVHESVATFRSGNYLASVVMLGAASEMLFDELGASVLGATASPSTTFKNKMNDRSFAKRQKAIVDWCRQNRNQLPGQWQQERQADNIDRVAELIRTRRNDAGHPQDPPAEPTHNQMCGWLQLFPDYCKTLNQLKDYLDDHPASIT